MSLPKLRPEPRPGGRVKKAKQTGERVEEERPRPLEETALLVIDPSDWRPRPPTLAQKMAGR